MGAESKTPDFAEGIARTALSGAVTAGYVRGEPALLFVDGPAASAPLTSFSIVGGTCSHYGAPLAKGLVDGDSVRCQWHHACFSLRDGSSRKAPGLAPLPRWQLEESGGLLRAGSKLPAAVGQGFGRRPPSVTIVGAGAAAMGAVAELRAQGYDGPITVFGAEAALPYDRVKLSKAFLSGELAAEKLALPRDFVRDAQGISWRTASSVVALDAKRKTLQLADGSQHPYQSLLWATGAEPHKLDVPGANQPHVGTLRSLADAEQLLTRLGPERKVVIVGASFIGLEAASILRQRGISVDVVAPKAPPMAKIFGRQLASHLADAHLRAKVAFHIPDKVARIEADEVVLGSGLRLPADVVLVAIGVAPRDALAKAAGIACDDGIVVNAQLETSAADIWAAGDVASHPQGGKGPAHVRIEHWAVAEQMGRTAARNMLGAKARYDAVPFFWTEQQGIKVRYVGHAHKLERSEIFGSLNENRAVIALYAQGQIAAVATINRDDVSLRCEQLIGRGELAALEEAVRG